MVISRLEADGRIVHDGGAREGEGRRMSPLRVALAFVAVAMFAIAALVAVPIAIEAGVLLKSEDDPAALADRALSGVFDQAFAVRQIEAALAANDPDLAFSFLELARERYVAIPEPLAEKVTLAIENANSATAHVDSFARGLITGEPENLVGLAGTALGDLFIYGDIRDAVREGTRYVSGQPADELVLGLSVVGLAITAGTYATVGAAGPARIGLSAVKAARRAGRMSAGMAAWIGRSLREAVDWSALKRAGAAIATPTTALREARTVVKAQKADGLMKLASDVGRVQTKAGTQAALDAMKIAEGLRDMARIAKLAEKKGTKTRAILKTLGRGAILLSIATFNLASWIFGALLTLIGLVASAKSCAERLTQRAIDRGKARKRERYVALMEQRA
jgi:hypothetical protein